MATWQVQQAKSKLSELIERATTEGPQTITKHGKPVAVLVSEETFRARQPKEPTLIEFLLYHGPKFDELDIERSKDTGREVDFD